MFNSGASPARKASTAARLTLFIKPALGPFKIVDVTRADVSSFIPTCGKSRIGADRTLGVMSKLFNLIEVWGLRPDGSNPCRHVLKYKEHRREAFLSKEQMVKLGDVLNRARRGRHGDGLCGRGIPAARSDRLPPW